MAGRYVTQTRPLPGLSCRYTTGEVGQRGEIRVGDVADPGSQVTTSYRTGPSWADEELAEDLRIFRNGFTSNDPRFDRGHEFSTEKRYSYSAGREVYLRYPNQQMYNRAYFYRGPIYPGWGSVQHRYRLGDWPTIQSWNQNEANVLGGKAIKNTVPTNPQANLSQFVGELFLGLPQMVGAATWKEGIQDFRFAGSEYLNVQFGWKPFLSDILKAAQALQQASKLIRQFERDSGRTVRRRFAFPESVSTETSSQHPSYRLFPNLYIPLQTVSIPPTESHTVNTRRVWFSGAYSYVLPVGSTNLQKLERYEALAQKLLGTRITPDTLWELAPWSWLVDWKFTIGDTLSNASKFSADSLVLRWGYLMVHDRAVRTFTSPVYSTQVYLDRTPSLSLSLVTERKKRVKATPYGFGVDTSNLSGSQWAILAALGLTKSPTQLR